MLGFILDNQYVLWGHVRKGPKVVGVTGNERAFAQIRQYVGQVVLVGKFFHITKNLSLGEIG